MSIRLLISFAVILIKSYQKQAKSHPFAPSLNFPYTQGMLYKVMADIVVFVHLGWIGFLVLGALWGARNRIVRVIHLGGLGFALLMQAMGWYCPLTHLEFWLRQRHAPELSYPGSFLAHYAEELVYLSIKPYTVLALTIAICGFSTWVYIRASKKERLRKASQPPGPH